MIRFCCLFLCAFLNMVIASTVLADAPPENLPEHLPEQLPEQLPEPLNLQQALKFAEDQQHHDLLQYRATLEQAEFRLQQAQSGQGFNAQLELEAAYVEPSSFAFDPDNNDSRVALRLNKALFDLSNAYQQDAAQIELKAISGNQSYRVAQRKIDIARQFFAVLLADLKYAWDNEAMAIAFVRFDADKDRYALKQMSDVEFLESENRYLDVFHRRGLSELAQRQSRARLAEFLNRPQQLPSNLTVPELKLNISALPEYSELLETAMKSNPALLMAKQQVVAAQQRIEAGRKQFYPTLEAEFEAADYARESASNDEWRAQLKVVMPLYKSQQMKSEMSLARAEWLKQQSRLQALQAQLRQQVLQAWQTVQLLEQRRQQLLTTQEYRELSLDRSRALYEMEVKTNLGDSMVAVSENRYQQAKNNFELTLAMMQLRLLVGKMDLLGSQW